MDRPRQRSCFRFDRYKLVRQTGRPAGCHVLVGPRRCAGTAGSAPLQAAQSVSWTPEIIARASQSEFVRRPGGGDGRECRMEGLENGHRQYRQACDACHILAKRLQYSSAPLTSMGPVIGGEGFGHIEADTAEHALEKMPQHAGFFNSPWRGSGLNDPRRPRLTAAGARIPCSPPLLQIRRPP